MRVGTAIAIVFVLVLPAVAFGDPGHGAEQPHLNAPQSNPNLAGARVTNFTAGQALHIHAGHDDVVAIADCGWGILFARNAQ